jgi:oligoribonuclease
MVIPLLVWMDLEMTGLDPTRHVIVEIATLITDDELNVTAEGPELVVRATEAELALMDDVVVDMHTRSGLLEQVRASTVTLAEAGGQTLDFLKAHITAPGTVPLCGNSIGMDRRFLAVHLPEIEEFLHYRSVDVSTLKELGRRWFPSVLATAPRKEAGHRALDDITESLEELRFYRAALFRSGNIDPSAPPDAPPAATAPVADPGSR